MKTLAHPAPFVFAQPCIPRSLFGIVLAAILQCLLSRAAAQTPLTLSLLDSVRSTSAASWARDNKTIYYTSGGAAWSLNTSDGTEHRMIEQKGLSGAPRVSLEGHRVAIAAGTTVLILDAKKNAIMQRIGIEDGSRWELTPSGTQITSDERGYVWTTMSSKGHIARIRVSSEMFGSNKLFIDAKEVGVEEGIYWIFSPYGSPLEWAPDGKRLYFLSSRTGWTKIWSMNTAGTDIRQETFGECDDRDFQVLTNGSLVFVSNRRQNMEWSLWIQAQGKKPRFAFGDWGTVQHPAVSPDARSVVFQFSSPTQPPELYIHDFRSGATQKVTRNTPGVLAQLLVTPKVLRFPSSDRTLEGLLFVPPGTDSIRTAPAIIRLHGGPSMHDGLAWNMSHQFLASRGFVVLAVNYTGSVGYGKTFEESDRYRIGMEDCDDIAAAARALQALPFVRGKRIGVCGTSYGGYLTNQVIGRYPHLFTAAVSWFGITDWFTMDGFQRLHPVVRYFFRDRMGSPLDHPALYGTASPITYADSIRTPLLLAHGDADTVVPIGQSEELYKLLKRRNAEVEITRYHSEGHGWSRPDTRMDAFRKMDEWFTHYLKD